MALANGAILSTAYDSGSGSTPQTAKVSTQVPSTFSKVTAAGDSEPGIKVTLKPSSLPKTQIPVVSTATTGPRSQSLQSSSKATSGSGGSRPGSGSRQVSGRGGSRPGSGGRVSVTSDTSQGGSRAGNGSRQTQSTASSTNGSRLAQVVQHAREILANEIGVASTDAMTVLMQYLTKHRDASPSDAAAYVLQQLGNNQVVSAKVPVKTEGRLHSVINQGTADEHRVDTPTSTHSSAGGGGRAAFTRDKRKKKKIGGERNV